MTLNLVAKVERFADCGTAELKLRFLEQWHFMSIYQNDVKNDVMKSLLYVLVHSEVQISWWTGCDLEFVAKVEDLFNLTLARFTLENEYNK